MSLALELVLKALDGASATLAGDAKTPGKIQRVRIVPIAQALQSEYLALNPPNAQSVITLDCDDPVWLERLHLEPIARPTIAVIDRDTDHAHLIYLLADPVHRNQGSRRGPIRLAENAAAGLKIRFSARGANQTLIRNPLRADSRFKSVCRPEQLWKLQELMDAGHDSPIPIAPYNCSAQFSALQSERGKASGRVRTRQNRDRDLQIVSLSRQGLSTRQIAREVQISYSRVSRILKRDS